MNREQLETWSERGILVLALVLLAWLPLAFGGRPQAPVGTFVDPLFVDPFVVAQLLTVGLLCCWLVRLWVSRKPRLLLPPMTWAVIAFVAYAVGRYLTADIEYVARQELLRILVYASLFLVVVNNLHRQETTHVIVFTVITLGTLMAFYAMYQFFADSNRVWHLTKPYTHRGTGTFISPNHLGGFLELTLPVALSFTILGRFKALPRIFLGYSSLVILAGIAVTLSRGTWAATVLALAFFFVVLLFHPGYRLISLGLLTLLVAGGIFLLPASNTIRSRMEQMRVQKDLEVNTRYALWQSALVIWRENPWWGVGPAHYDYRFREHRPEAIQQRPDRAHNDFLNTLADWGIVGASLIGIACAVLALGAVKTWRFVRKVPKDIGGTTQSTKAAFVVGATTGLLAIFFHSAVDFNMHVPANAVLAVTWMALLASHIRFATDNFWFTAGPWRKGLLTILLLAGIGYLGWQGGRRSIENYWLAKGLNEPVYSAARTDALKRAFAVEPKNDTTARWIGEALKVRTAMGTDDYVALAEEAISWFDRASRLNRWDGNSLLLQGWCLDWLGRCSESGPLFSRAELLGANSYYTVAQIGLHYVQCGDLAAARRWFERSLRLDKVDNPIAATYLQIVNDRLRADALAAGPRGKN